MDGITPTLAFAALFFGLSGNARDAADDRSAAFEIEDGSGCSTLIVAGNPVQLPSQEMWAEEFWNTAARGATLPDLNLMDPGLVEIESSRLGDPAPATVNDGSDPVMRRTIPASTNVAPDLGIAPCRSKP